MSKQLALFDDIEIGIDYLENRTDEELFNLGAASKLGTEILIGRGYSFDEVEAEYERRATPIMLSYERGKLYLNRDKQQGKRNDLTSVQNAPKLEDEFGVSKDTLKRDAQFAKAVDKIDEVSHDLGEEILHNESGLTKQDVIELSKDSAEVILEIAEMPKEERKQDGNFHISSKQNDWYTPGKYIEAARSTLGIIDIDPASSELAQETVKATTYFTEETNGLDKEWLGKVWMNPPYSMPEIQQFIDKLFESNVEEWIVLTNNSSDTGWFHKLLDGADLVCFTKGRVGFENIQGDTMATRQGQTFFYKGKNHIKFIEEFNRFGAIMEVLHVHKA